MSDATPEEDPQESLVRKMERAVAAEAPLIEAEIVLAEKNAREEKGYLEDHRHRYFKLRNDNYEQDIQVRREYADKIFKLICFWLGAIMFLLLTSGMDPGHSLPESVLLAAIGSTTASVLGLLYIIVNYLFPKR